MYKMSSKEEKSRFLTDSDFDFISLLKSLPSRVLYPLYRFCFR